MAAPEQYAAWIVANRDKQGTPEFAKVAEAYRLSKGQNTARQDAEQQIQGDAITKSAQAGPIAEMGFFDRALAGAGQAVANVGRGAGQMLGMTTKEEVAEARQRDMPLSESGGGKVGNLVGNLAMFVPTIAIPGANTYTGAALTGAAMGALTPTAGEESRLLNTGLGASGGMIGKYGGDKLTGAVSNRLADRVAANAVQQSQNAPRDAILNAARAEGYVVPPASVNPTLTNRALESVATKTGTSQVASIKNQAVTNKLARKAIGMADDAPLTEGALEAVRQQAGKAYEAIKQVPGTFKADQQFGKDIAAIGNDFSAAAREFPELVKNEAVDTLRAALSKPEVSPAAAMDVIRKLRFDASRNFKAIDDPAKAALAQSQRQAADAIEGLIERNLVQQGNGALVPAFRQARQLIAKTHDVEAALTEGGNVSAAVLARMMERGKPMSGELATAAKFGSEFRQAARLPEVVGSPAVSGSKLGFGMGLGGMGIGGALGGAPGAILGGASMFAPTAARNAILSNTYQNAMAMPSYGAPAGLTALQAILQSAGASYAPLGALTAINAPEPKRQ